MNCKGKVVEILKRRILVTESRRGEPIPIKFVCQRGLKGETCSHCFFFLEQLSEVQQTNYRR